MGFAGMSEQGAGCIDDPMQLVGMSRHVLGASPQNAGRLTGTTPGFFSEFYAELSWQGQGGKACHLAFRLEVLQPHRQEQADSFLGMVRMAAPWIQHSRLVQVRTRGGRVAGRALTTFENAQPSSSDEGAAAAAGGGAASDSEDYDPAPDLLARQQVCRRSA